MGNGQRSSVQLQLIAGGAKGPGARRRTRAWRLDARTREIGRDGVAEARAILSQVTPPQPLGRRRAG